MRMESIAQIETGRDATDRTRGWSAAGATGEMGWAASRGTWDGAFSRACGPKMDGCERARMGGEDGCGGERSRMGDRMVGLSIASVPHAIHPRHARST